MYGQKKNFSTFSYRLVQISPIMILVNSGAFLSISSWFCELTKLIFVMIPYISSTGYPPQNARDYVLCASSEYSNLLVAVHQIHGHGGQVVNSFPRVWKSKWIFSSISHKFCFIFRIKPLKMTFYSNHERIKNHRPTS